ncbi:MAG: hypothetical protein IBJ11_04705 [Phycisphaerales bacterium]|nr:hypothetical protein [Phycisphaerales bacterium]
MSTAAPAPARSRLRIPEAPRVPWEATPFPGTPVCPTLLTRFEIDYLHHLARNCTARGRIIDLGCFFGGSTEALAVGLRDNARFPMGWPAGPVLAYDSFVLCSWGERAMNCGLRAGECFMDRVRASLAPLGGLTDLRKGWIPGALASGDAERIYPEQEPIELLMIDCAKDWPVMSTILRVFGPHLEPGAVVVQQDFKHFSTPWIPVFHAMLTDCFSLLHSVPASASVSFRYEGGLTPERLADLPRTEDFAADDIDAVWDAAEGIFGPSLGEFGLVTLRLQRAHHFAYAGHWPRAAEALNRAEPGVAALAAETASKIAWERENALRNLAGRTRAEAAPGRPLSAAEQALIARAGA